MQKLLDNILSIGQNTELIDWFY